MLSVEFLNFFADESRVVESRFAMVSVFWRRSETTGGGVLPRFTSLGLHFPQTYVRLPHKNIILFKICKIPQNSALILDSVLISQFRDSVRDSVIAEIIGPYICHASDTGTPQMR